MSYNLYDNMFKEYTRYYPVYSEDTIDYRPWGNNGLILTLRDGRELFYDANHNMLKLPLIRRKDESNVEFGFRKFATNLRFIMGNRGHTEASLGERSGLSQKVINNYLRRVNSPTIETVYKLADALDCNIGELID